MTPLHLFSFYALEKSLSRQSATPFLICAPLSSRAGVWTWGIAMEKLISLLFFPAPHSSFTKLLLYSFILVHLNLSRIDQLKPLRSMSLLQLWAICRSAEHHNFFPQFLSTHFPAWFHSDTEVWGLPCRRSVFLPELPWCPCTDERLGAHHRFPWRNSQWCWNMGAETNYAHDSLLFFVAKQNLNK